MASIYTRRLLLSVAHLVIGDKGSCIVLHFEPTHAWLEIHAGEVFAVLVVRQSNRHRTIEEVTMTVLCCLSLFSVRLQNLRPFCRRVRRLLGLGIHHRVRADQAANCRDLLGTLVLQGLEYLLLLGRLLRFDFSDQDSLLLGADPLTSAWL